MSLLRKVRLKHTIAVLFLLASSLSQIQVLFACDFQDGTPAPLCCCDGDMSDGCGMGGGCADPRDMRADSGCCTVSVDSLSELTLAGPSPASFQVEMLEAPQPPPALVVATAPGTLPRNAGHVSMAPRLPPPREDTSTYLLTRRLRI